MNFFHARTTWSNLEFVPLKLCIASFYLCFGAYFSSFFSTLYIPLLLLFVVTMIISLSKWFSKMKKENG